MPESGNKPHKDSGVMLLGSGDLGHTASFPSEQWLSTTNDSAIKRYLAMSGDSFWFSKIGKRYSV